MGGEALTANFGIGLIAFAASFVGLIPLILGGVALAAGHTYLGIAALVIGILGLLIVSLVSSAMNAIIIGALYLYAAEGTVPRQFDDRLFRDAFSHK